MTFSRIAFSAASLGFLTICTTPPAHAQVQPAGVCLTESVARASPLGNKASEQPRGDRALYERIAIRRWEAEVTKTYGGAYADWKNAKSKSLRCPSATAQRRWRCVARGTPCRGGTLN